MLSAESYALTQRKNGRSLRRRWVKLCLHTKRLASIGANAVELQGLFGHVARALSWTVWLLLLLWNLLARTVRKLVTPVSDAMEDALARFRAGHRLRRQVHEYITHLRSLGHRRQAGRGAGMALLCSATIMIISSCCFSLGFEVRMNGESLGFVDSPSQVQELVERVESRIGEYLNAPYSLDTDFSYTLRYMDRTNPLDEKLL
jgi:hypothetical protein